MNGAAAPILLMLMETTARSRSTDTLLMLMETTTRSRSTDTLLMLMKTITRSRSAQTAGSFRSVGSDSHHGGFAAVVRSIHLDM